MKGLFLILFFICISLNPHAQDLSDYIQISGTVTEFSTNLPLENVEVKIYRNKELIEKVYSDSLGKYKFQHLPLNTTYEIHFIQKKYCYKFATINVRDVNESLDGIFTLDVGCAIFKVGVIKNYRLRFLRKEPVAIAYYNKSDDNLEWDLEYIELMKNKIRRKGGK